MVLFCSKFTTQNFGMALVKSCTSPGCLSQNEGLSGSAKKGCLLSSQAPRHQLSQSSSVQYCCLALRGMVRRPLLIHHYPQRTNTYLCNFCNPNSPLLFEAASIQQSCGKCLTLFTPALGSPVGSVLCTKISRALLL